MAKKTTFTGILTGDIMSSRTASQKKWLPVLRKILNTEGKSPGTWEIYRGDSFQLEVKNPEGILLTAIRIKTNLKAIGVDVRMAIGIGEKKMSDPRITEAQGEAFIFSGEKLETLKKENQTLAVKTRWGDFDREMNLLLRLALIVMDKWSVNAAELIAILLDSPGTSQAKLAKKLKITQSAVSGRQKRAYYYEIMELEALFRDKIKNLTA